MEQVGRKLEVVDGSKFKVYVGGDHQEGLGYLRRLLEAYPTLRSAPIGVACVYIDKEMRAKIKLLREQEKVLVVQEHAFVGERRLSPEDGYFVLGDLEKVLGRELALAYNMHASAGFTEVYSRLWLPNRALIIEDDPSFVEWIREKLEPYGFSRIDVARDRKEVRDILSTLTGNGDFDLMTVDCGLGPDMGFGPERRSVELVRELIAKGEGVKRIIVCSGSPTMMQPAIEIGAKFVIKPRISSDIHPAIIDALTEH